MNYNCSHDFFSLLMTVINSHRMLENLKQHPERFIGADGFKERALSDKINAETELERRGQLSHPRPDLLLLTYSEMSIPNHVE